ncbi:hypothetical protein OGATHE_000960 [Ogataea polymorpha]|uniref:Uncharacterized protein n=1 Tax=Ogataea polymorpha TaxID=460523 RepID=A0A9P8PSJ3_9ASCO|nr:hypothetical protein OGATHE_000960 [Ogataea polymorpha]
MLVRNTLRLALSRDSLTSSSVCDAISSSWLCKLSMKRSKKAVCSATKSTHSRARLVRLYHCSRQQKLLSTSKPTKQKLCSLVNLWVVKRALKKSDLSLQYFDKSSFTCFNTTFGFVCVSRSSPFCLFMSNSMIFRNSSNSAVEESDVLAIDHIYGNYLPILAFDKLGRPRVTQLIGKVDKMDAIGDLLDATKANFMGGVKEEKVNSKAQTFR